MSKSYVTEGPGESQRAQNLTSVRSIERALNILECFTKEKPLLSLADISSKLELYPSTTLRVLTTLENRGYIRRNSKTLEYSLGYKLINLSSICIASENLRDMVRPFLIQLRDKYNETVGLYVLSDDKRICIDSVPSTQALQRSVEIGKQLSLTRGASGKIMLAYLPEEKAAKIIEKDPCITFEYLQTLREAGYAVSFSENAQNLVSIATPIFNVDHQIIATLFISGPVNRMEEKLIKDIAEYMKGLSHQISLLCGY